VDQLVLCQNGAVFEWSGSEFYELNYWSHL
jgi:hypothetical protein